MILVVCTDDRALLQIAKSSSQGNPEIYGNFYQIFHDQLPTLGQREKLFIIAHGAFKGDDNNPVIGDQKRAFYVNGVQLYTNLASIIPANYDGSVYIDACESADQNRDTFSFAEAFKSQIQPGRPNPKVFGRNGTVSGKIPLPDAPGWVQA